MRPRNERERVDAQRHASRNRIERERNKREALGWLLMTAFIWAVMWVVSHTQGCNQALPDLTTPTINAPNPTQTPRTVQ